MPRRRKPREAFVLERSIEIDAPVERIYRFHLDTRNAPIVAPPDARISFVDGTFPLVEGARVRMRIRTPPLPKPQEWRLRVEAVVPSRAIVTVGLSARPFTEWRHEHRFEPIGRDRTRLTDRIAYRLPGGPLAALLDRSIVAKRLGRTIAAKQQNTKTYLERRR